MVAPVSDFRSNPNDQIAHAVKVLGRSKDRLAVFKAIHHGKAKVKTVSQIETATGLSRKRVLEEGVKLVHKQIVAQTGKAGDIAYARDSQYYGHLKEILAQVANPAKRKAFPTKYNAPKGTVIRIAAPRKLIHTKIVTIDDIDSFAKVKKIKSELTKLPMAESTFKKGVQKIIGQGGTFKDWGGETSDLFTTNVRFDGRRTATAFAFKGKGLKGRLTNANMGKNGDQVQRLFQEDADLFLIQHVEDIAPSMLQLMAVFAQAKSLSTGRKIHYGLIDGQDSNRLVSAYSKFFSSKKVVKKK